MRREDRTHSRGTPEQREDVIAAHGTSRGTQPLPHLRCKKARAPWGTRVPGSPPRWTNTHWQIQFLPQARPLNPCCAWERRWCLFRPRSWLVVILLASIWRWPDGWIGGILLDNNAGWRWFDRELGPVRLGGALCDRGSATITPAARLPPLAGAMQNV